MGKRGEWENPTVVHTFQRILCALHSSASFTGGIISEKPVVTPVVTPFGDVVTAPKVSPWSGPFNTDIPGIGYTGSREPTLAQCKVNCQTNARCKAIQYSATDLHKGRNCFLHANQADNAAPYNQFQIFKFDREVFLAIPEAWRPGFEVDSSPGARAARRAQKHRDMNLMWAAGVTNMANKWEARKQAHLANQKLASDWMKAAMKAASDTEDTDPEIGDEYAGETIRRSAMKGFSLRQGMGPTAAVQKAWAYVLNSTWPEVNAMKVEEELSMLRPGTEVGVLWIQGEGPWQPENLKMTLMLVVMFEEMGGWITVTTEKAKKWKDKTNNSAWIGKDLEQVMKQHYGNILTDESIAAATTVGPEEQPASFGTWTAQSMPGYYSAGWATTHGSDSVTFLPAAGWVPLE